ncbi:hypothetical protein VTL71DRAFT_6404 [Oculimacula yallundae]|uniref:Uncharacterized protein n=1 Tax=Oculimacula yallundae TaxID=86028 RepID=A0ABR4BZH8_9HELO
MEIYRHYNPYFVPFLVLLHLTLIHFLLTCPECEIFILDSSLYPRNKPLAFNPRSPSLLSSLFPLLPAPRPISHPDLLLPQPSHQTPFPSLFPAQKGKNAHKTQEQKKSYPTSSAMYDIQVWYHSSNGSSEKTEKRDREFRNRYRGMWKKILLPGLNNIMLYAARYANLTVNCAGVAVLS